MNTDYLNNYINYIKSKFTKKVSKEPITIIVNKGKLIYIDIEGPISPISNKGLKYYITFLDYKTKLL